MYIEDFRRVLREIGCLDYRIVAKSSVEISDNKFIKIGMVNFSSIQLEHLNVFLKICVRTMVT